MPLIPHWREILTFFLLAGPLLGAFGLAQSERADSLLQAAAETDSLPLAKALTQEATDLLQKAQAQQAWAYAWVDLAFLYADQGQIEAAISILDTAIARLWWEGNQHSVFLAINQGYLCGEIGDFARARLAYERGVQMVATDTTTSRMARHLFQPLGNIYTRQGRYEQARFMLQQALAWAEKHGTSAQQASIMSDLGVALSNMALDSLAQGYYQQAIRLPNLDPSQKGLLLSNLAEMKLGQGQVKAARRDILQAVQELKQANIPYYLMGANRIAGVILGEDQAYARGRSYLKQALDLAINDVYNRPFHRDIADIYLSMARLERQANQPQQALAYTQQALQALLPAFHPEDLSENPAAEQYFPENMLLLALAEKAKVYQQLYAIDPQIDWLKHALRCSEDALLVKEHFIQQYQTQSDQLDLLGYVHQHHELALEIAYQLYQAEDTQNGLDKGFYFSEKSKAVLLNMHWQALHGEANEGVPESIQIRERAIKSRINEWVLEKSAALQAGARTNDSLIQAINQALFQERASLDSLITVIESSFPAYFQSKYDLSVLSLPDLQKQLSENAVMLNYFQGESALFVFRIQRNEVRWYRLPWDQEQTTHIRELGEALTGSYLHPDRDRQAYTALRRQKGWQLYQALLAPVLEDLSDSIQRLIIIPDGPLGYIPFGVLPKSALESNWTRETEPYLIKSYQISYAYSATLFDRVSQQANAMPRYQQVLAVAPSYDLPQQEEALRTGIGQLLFNREEAEMVVQRLGGTILAGPAASKERFLTEAPQYAYLHLAAHGNVNDQFDALSFLAFSATKDSVELGFLRLSELYLLRLHAELVVLSACETGIGELYQGEGISSLARGFISAGARSIITTLWQISDRSSLDFMDSFYEELSKGLPKDEALRQAQLKFIELGYDPYFWAAFLPMGDMRPVSLSPRQTGSVWFYGLIALGALGLLYGGYRLIRHSATQA